MNEKIQKALRENGYTQLYPMQEKMIPVILEGSNLFIQAHTGSGKTLMYLIPTLETADSTSAQTEVLIITPTRELAMQVSETAKKIASYSGHHIIMVIGGMDITKQENALKHRPTIVIGTPGRLHDLASQGLLDLSHLKLVVLDEADQIISTGQRMETKQLLHNYNGQVVALSATRNPDMYDFLPTDTKDYLFSENELHTQISSYYIKTDHRRHSLKKLLRNSDIKQAIIFVNYKNDANELALSLQNEGILCSSFSSFYEEKERIRILKAFKEGSLRILVATDAAARGLDLSDLSHIIHYDLPTDTATFIHRSGRSGHQGNDGLTITLLREEDQQTEVGQYIMETGEPYQLERSQSDLSIPLEKEEQSSSKTMDIQIRAGRRDKLRPKDIIGALCTKVSFEDIGVLEIQDSYTTVTLLRDDIKIEDLDHLKIKGKNRRIVRR